MIYPTCIRARSETPSCEKLFDMFGSTMASSGFGPYHGMSLEDDQTKRVGVITTPCVMTYALGLVQFPPQHEKAGPLQVKKK